MDENKITDDGFQEVGGTPSNQVKLEKPGDQLEGTLKSVSPTSLNNKAYIVVKENGDEVVLFGSTVLNGRMQHIAIGETIRVVYKGDIKSKTGRAYKDYAVFRKVTPQEERVS